MPVEKILITDNRLTSEMTRVRSGSTQLFRRKGIDRCFTNKENADAVIEAPSPELYAELIEGKWYWVNGCAECNGKPRGWTTYIECDKHNVCRTCGKSRKEAVTAWGGKNGWQCGSCHDNEAATIRKEALRAVASKEYDELDYCGTDKIICPHCASSYERDCEVHEGDEICDVCGGEYTVEPEYSVTFTTRCKGPRLTT